MVRPCYLYFRCFSVVCTILSVWNIWRRMVGWFTDGELENIWKEMVVAYLRYCPTIILEKQRETTKIRTCMPSVSTEIQVDGLWMQVLSFTATVTVPRIDISTKWDKPIKFWAFRRHSSGRNCALRPCCSHVTSMAFWVVGPLPWPIYIYFSLSLGWRRLVLALLLYTAQSCKH